MNRIVLSNNVAFAIILAIFLIILLIINPELFKDFLGYFFKFLKEVLEIRKTLK